MKKTKLQLWQKVTLGLILGAIFGSIFPHYAATLKPVGDIFLRAIKMIIPALVFLSLISGVTGVSSNASLRHIGMKATMIFIVVTFFSVGIGIAIGLILEPGKGVFLNLGNSHSSNNVSEFNFINFLVEVIPDNYFRAMIDGNTMQIVFIAIFTGVIMNSINTSVTEIKNLFNQALKLVLKMVSVIMEFSPFASFALTAYVVGTQGFDVMITLSKLVFSVIFAIFLQYVIFGLMIIFFARISPMPFYKKSLEYQAIAFSTSSSKVTLPITMQTCREKMGISETSSSFILPLGASINMSGMAINLSLTTIFFAQVTNTALSLQDYLMIVLTSTIGSIGGAGIPGASLIMLPMIFSSVHIPIEGIAILAGIDRIIDMMRTTISITGDAAITLIIDAREGLLDREIYNKEF